MSLRKKLLIVFATVVAWLFFVPDFVLAQHGIVSHEEELGALTLQMAHAVVRLNAFTENRLHYFEHGLGWIAEPACGFYSGRDAAYFSPDAWGFDSYEEGGEKRTGIVAALDGDTLWVTYRDYTSPAELTVGYRTDGKVTYTRWTLRNGTRCEFWDRNIRVRWPDESMWYALYRIREEPILDFSPAFITSIFTPAPYSEKTQAAMDDITADIPYLYTVRIIADARLHNVNLADTNESARYAVNWFRKLLGLPEVSGDPLLGKAAENHLHYLLINNIPDSLNGVPPEEINTYLLLHDESPGRPGFTGKKVADRTEATGYGRNVGETITMAKGEPISEIAAWFHTIYHRRPYLIPETVHVTHARAGYGPTSVAVANWGIRSHPVENRDGGVLYPVDGETLVPCSWAAIEAPDPFPGNTSGTGPAFSWYTDPVPEGARFRLRRIDGSSVALRRTDVAKDSKFLEAIPVAPLEPGNSYHLEVLSGGQVLASSTFTTAPVNPAVTVLDHLSGELPARPHNQSGSFDLKAARKANERKGELFFTQGETGAARMTSEKYEFQFTIPEGWEEAERTWQHVHLVHGYASIHISLYAAGAVPKATDIRAQVEGQLDLSPAKESRVQTPSLRGIRVEYEWEYSGKAIVYYLVFGNYAIVVYGYGVEGPEIASIVSTLTSTQ